MEFCMAAGQNNTLWHSLLGILSYLNALGTVHAFSLTAPYSSSKGGGLLIQHIRDLTCVYNVILVDTRNHFSDYLCFPEIKVLI